MLYPALLPLMRTPRLPVFDWTDDPADLNGLVHFAERRNLVSARVPSHFNWPLLQEQASGRTRCAENIWPYLKFGNQLPRWAAVPYCPSSSTMTFGAPADTVRVSMPVLGTKFQGRIISLLPLDSHPLISSHNVHINFHLVMVIKVKFLWWLASTRRGCGVYSSWRRVGSR
jgi:hypothetical protein